ncbi:MAG: hypothetical protein M3P91_12010 [Actinomycetota bacterium]|nr:hypothetical protein [Actinomycetota bacterium]
MRADVTAAALPRTRVPPRCTMSVIAAGISVSRHWRSAYVGLPGPVNTQRAVARTAIADARAAGPSSRERHRAASTGRPTVSAK